MSDTYDRRLLTANDPAGKKQRSELFGRHFVYLIGRYKPERAGQEPVTASAFLIDLGGQCYVVTAGHVITKMRAVRDGGQQFENFSAMDVFGGGQFREAVPLGLGIDDFAAEFDEGEASGIDVAIAPLPDYIVRVLAKNNTVPIPASADMEQLLDEPYDKLLLAGIPAETVTHGAEARGKKLEVTMASVIMSALGPEQASSVISQGPYERIYGQISPDVREHVESVAGMSGGPVFGLWYSQDGAQFRYTVIGIQSGWDPGARQIAAWPIGYMIAHFSRPQE